MKNLKYKGVKLAGLAIACIAISACEKTNFENPVGETDSYSSGTADFSNFVSIGDSLTAGYADSALYKSGQENSVPAILSQQFAEVGGGTFVQPLVSDNLGGLLFGGMENPEFGNRLVLNVDPKNPPDDLDPKGPEPISGIPTTEVFGNTGGVLYNNVGVPGAKSFHFGLPGYGDSAGLLTSPATANPYFVRFASSTTTTIIT
ncbi:MAG: G-D-S-L family lipolytic protein, partial [Gammaproteobacteria bacterium]|nr:G-D-S-L family lipolytic protein [Gammaproteobacteria bacterium]